jgi:hypothetical protein
MLMKWRLRTASGRRPAHPVSVSPERAAEVIARASSDVAAPTGLEPATARWLLRVRTCCELMQRAPQGSISRLSVTASIDAVMDGSSAVRTVERIAQEYGLYASCSVAEHSVTVGLSHHPAGSEGRPR